MRRITLLVALAALGSTPAHSMGGKVQLNNTAIVKPLGAGYLVIAICEATAVPEVLQDTPDPALSTTVWCESNGVSDMRSVAGHKAVAIVTNATETPIAVCSSGTATFLDVDAAVTYASSLGPKCSPVGPGE